MKRRLKRIALALALASSLLTGGVWLLIHSLGDRETVYAGHPIGYWVSRLADPNTNVSNEASQILQTVALPALVQTLASDTNDSKLRASLVGYLNGLAGVSIPYTPAEGRRTGAAVLLGQLGPLASKAVPQLVRGLRDPSGAVRHAAVWALGQIHQEPELAVPALMERLADKDERMPLTAMAALARFGGQAGAAVPKLRQLAASRDDEVRQVAERTLQRILPSGGSETPAETKPETTREARP